MRIGRALGLGVAVASMVVVTACSNNTPAGGSNSTSGGGGGGGKGTVVISGQNFGEMQIMASMYQQVLQHAGYTVPTPEAGHDPGHLRSRAEERCSRRGPRLPRRDG